MTFSASTIGYLGPEQQAEPGSRPMYPIMLYENEIARLSQLIKSGKAAQGKGCTKTILQHLSTWNGPTSRLLAK
jgi:hypothetical protein